MSSESWEYRWASETGTNGMPYPEELEYLGYTKFLRHKFYQGSWLYRRKVPAPDREPGNLTSPMGDKDSSPSKELANPGLRPDGDTPS